MGRILNGLAGGRPVLLRGCRGTGKATILRQVAAAWVRQTNNTPDRVIFLDLEDPVLPRILSPDVLDQLVGKVEGRRLLLLNGVGRFPGWLEWARVKAMEVVAARSGATTNHLAPRVEGLEVVDCYPVDIASWIRLFTDKSVNTSTAREVLPGYLSAGGLPLARQAEGRRQALIGLFFRILFQDVVLQSEVRDPGILTDISVDLLGASGQPVSANRLKGAWTRSVDQARMFLNHLVEAGLIELVARLEDAERSAAQASRLCFACDTGLATALRVPGEEKPPNSLDSTAVFHAIRRTGTPVYAFRSRDRLGLALGDPHGPEWLVDIQDEGGLSPKPLTEALRRWNCPRGLLLSNDPATAVEELPSGATLFRRPVWEFLLDPQLQIRSVSKPTDKSVEPVARVMIPRHLL